MRFWVWLLLGALMADNLYGQLVSPEVHADRSVTFRARAPEAKRVLVKGLGTLPATAMSKDPQGNWSVTVGPLPADLYSYVLEVDGADQLDIFNRSVKKWLSLENQVEVPGERPGLHERARVPHGAVHWHSYESQTTGGERGVYVYTPPGYDPRASQTYPVVFLLHGYGDDESAWTEVGRAHFMADNLIAAGRIQPLLIVMPYGHPLTLDRSLPFDNYADRNLTAMEQDLLTDLEPFVRRHYLIADDRQQRAIVGLSMGGGQSLTIGLNHLDHFSRIGGFSSASPQGPAIDQLAAFRDAVAETNARIELLWIGCGKEDFLLERNEAFVKRLRERGVEHEYHLTEGNHSWPVWRRYLPEFLEKSFPARD